MLRYFLSALVAICSAGSSFAGGREVAVPELGSAAYPLSLGTISSNGNGFIAVWRTEMFDGGLHIDGSLIDGSGHRLSPSAMRVVSLTDARSMQVIPFGDHYALAWTDTKPMLNIAEISSDGHLIRMIASRPMPLFFNERIAWNGETFLQVEQSPPAEGFDAQITGTILDRDGNVIRTAIPLHHGLIESSALISVGSEFILLTTGTGGVVLRRISSTGEVTSRIVIDIPLLFSARSVAAASDGQSIAVTWDVSDTGGTNSINSVVVSKDGSILKRSLLPIREPQYVFLQNLHATSSGYVLVLNSRITASDMLRGAIIRFDRSMSTADDAPVPLSSDWMAINSSAISGTTLYVLSIGSRSYSGAITGTVIDVGQDQPARTEMLSIMPTRHSAPVIGSDGVGFLAAWIDATANTQSLRARLIDRSGTPTAAELELTSVSGYLGSPAMAYGSGTYLVVWQNGTQILGRRITSDGILLEDAPFVIAAPAIAGGPANPTVACNGRQFLVAWTQWKVYGAFVSATGNVSLSKQLSIDPAPPQWWNFSDNDARLAWDGKQFLLLWTLYRSPQCLMPVCQWTSEIRAIRLDAAAQPIDKESLLVADNAQRASVAASGENSMIVVDDGNGNHGVPVDARGPSLKLGAPIDIFRSWTLPVSNVIWTGHDYFVVWRYVTPVGWRLGSLHLSESGHQPANGVLTARGDSFTPPQVAANSIGDLLIAIAEVPEKALTAASARTTIYAPDAMTPLPAVPRTPVAIDATGVFPNVVVTWKDVSDNEEGFVIEECLPTGCWIAGFAPANSEQIRLRLDLNGSVRVRAWNAGGASNPSGESTPHAPPRRRSVGQQGCTLPPWTRTGARR